MVTIRSDRVLGREIWKLLHIIAVNFPDNGLTNQRLKGYYDFYKSLGHVLPRASWRATWRRLTAVGDTELAWPAFQTVRDHRQVSRWLFGVHDAVRRELKQTTASSYEKLYGGYRKYRENASANAKNRAEDPAGVGKIRALLLTRSKAMDKYLNVIYGGNAAQWPRARKMAMRKSHLDQAAAWYWDAISNQAARTDPGFDELSVAQRRNRILKQFDFNYRMRPQRVVNAIASLPGAIKNSVLA